MGDAMRATAMSGSRRTTLVAGIASAGALLLDPAVIGRLPVQPTPDVASTIVLRGPVVDVIALLLAVLAAVVLACGVRGEPGLLRASRVAGVAVLAAAGAQVALALTRLLVGPTLAGSVGPALPSGVVVLTQAMVVIHATVLVVLAVTVVRGRLLEPLARLSLLVLALATAASWLLGTLLGTLLGALPAAGGGDALVPLLSALPSVILVASAGLAVGLLVHGRSAAMRERAATIRRSW
jgi:hypothetical protein